jgi:hypothetical protein
LDGERLAHLRWRLDHSHARALPFWLRGGIIFSYFIAYQYAVVARSYALDLLLIPLIAATFASRFNRPAGTARSWVFSPMSMHTAPSSRRRYLENS